MDWLRRSIFEEPPADLDETWTHGALVGGLAWATQPHDIAASYWRAVDALIDAALQGRTPERIIYPVLFLCRHAIELSLKTLVPNHSHNHKLPCLIQSADAVAHQILEQSQADWLTERLTEFAEVDCRSTAFRFAYAGSNDRVRSDGEWWIDLHHLKRVTAGVHQLLEQLAADKPGGVPIE